MAIDQVAMRGHQFVRIASNFPGTGKPTLPNDQKGRSPASLENPTAPPHGIRPLKIVKKLEPPRVAFHLQASTLYLQASRL